MEVGWCCILLYFMWVVDSSCGNVFCIISGKATLKPVQKSVTIVVWRWAQRYFSHGHRSQVPVEGDGSSKRPFSPKRRIAIATFLRASSSSFCTMTW